MNEILSTMLGYVSSMVLNEAKVFLVCKGKEMILAPLSSAKTSISFIAGNKSKDINYSIENCFKHVFNIIEKHF